MLPAVAAWTTECSAEENRRETGLAGPNPLLDINVDCSSTNRAQTP